MAELVRYIAELRSDQDSLQSLSIELSELRKKLPDEVFRGPDAIPLDKVGFLAGLLDDVQTLLIQRLSQGPTE